MIKVCVVGAGLYGLTLIQAFYEEHKRGNIRLSAVADINSATLERARSLFRLRGYTDYREMFDREKPDAVAIVTPDHLHKEITVDALKRGIHVLVQKPLATTSRDASEMCEAARKANLMLYVDFHKRFDPAHIQLWNAVKSGLLGEIEYGYACMEDKLLVPSEWFKAWAHASSPAWFLGVQFFDLAYWILGRRPVSVYATGVKKKLLSLGIDSYDSIQSKFMFESDISVTFDSSWIIPNSFPSIVNQQIRFVGTEGMQEVDSQDRGVTACYAGDNASRIINPYGKLDEMLPSYGENLTGYTIDSMLYFLKLVQKIREGSATLETLKGHYPSGEEASVSTRMCEALHESISSGKIVKI